MNELSVILPVHNEEEIIEPVFKDIYDTLRKMGISFEIVLVENGSSDASFKVIKNIERKYHNVKSIQSTPGYGNAVLKGIKSTKSKYISYMPSDGQVDAKKIASLWKLIHTESYDLVKVKRTTRENVGRYLVSKTFSLLMMLFFQTPFIDINASPRIISRKKFNLLQLHSTDSFGDGEMLIKATYLKWKIKEIPMRNINRIGGKSTRKLATYTEFIQNIIAYRFSPELQRWKKEIRNT